MKTMKQVLESTERDYLVEAMIVLDEEGVRGAFRETLAIRLGLSVATLYRRMAYHGLRIRDYHREAQDPAVPDYGEEESR